MARIYTKTGDDGTTGLLYGGRVDKSDDLVEVLGDIDEAVAALGNARATPSISHSPTCSCTSSESCSSSRQISLPAHGSGTGSSPASHR